MRGGARLLAIGAVRYALGYGPALWSGGFGSRLLGAHRKGPQPHFHGRGHLRQPEQIALQLAASHLSKLLELLESFDPLRGGGHPQTFAQGSNRSDDCRTICPLREFANKALIDLDLVKRKLSQIAQA